MKRRTTRRKVKSWKKYKGYKKVWVKNNNEHNNIQLLHEIEKGQSINRWRVIRDDRGEGYNKFFKTKKQAEEYIKKIIQK